MLRFLLAPRWPAFCPREVRTPLDISIANELLDVVILHSAHVARR